MKYLAILVISVISLVNADSGHYVPRSVYFIDENGNPSVPRPINSEIINRVRRQIQPIQPFGGFAFPQPIFNFPQIQPGQGGQTSIVQSSQTLSSRFGEDEPIVTGQTQTFHSSGGKYQQTNTVLRPDGSVQTNKQTGRTKRQTSQIQSQGHEDGKTQFQSQTNDAPGGTQFQSQNQPGMTQTQSQGDGPIPQQSNVVPSDRAQNFDNRQPTPQHQPIPGQTNHPQGQQNYPQGQQNHPQGQQNYPQGQPNYPQGQQNYPQGQPNYPQGQPNYPQGQPNYQQGGFPFGFGGFGLGTQGFGFPQAGFGFPQQPGFAFAPGFQPAFGMGGPGIPQQGVQTGFVSQTLDNRFGEDEPPTVVGGTQTITSQNGVFHATSSVLKPNGQVETTHHSGNQRGQPFSG